ncbi:MAG: HlyC/CorC family transporter [Gammaproteobacteria bacterium]|nr:HlyC/CorC family transporter [Gammaproteobacteria bacterium]
MSYGSDILVIMALVLLNGFFAMAELAVVSARPARLRAMRQKRIPGAAAALTLNENPERFLSTVQIGITVVGIFAGVFGGEQLAPPLKQYLSNFQPFASYADELAIFAVVSAITYVSIVIGELVPKQLAIRRAAPIAVVVAPVLVLLAKIMAPLVFILRTSSRLVLILLGAAGGPRPQIIEEEVDALISEGVREGQVAPQEQQMISGVMRLADWKVRAIKTPGVYVQWLDLDADAETQRRTLAESSFSRLVVAQGDLSRPLGIVQKEELLRQLLSGRPLDIRAALRAPLYVDDHTSTLRVLDQLRQSPVHMAIVLDADKHVSGVVTTFDILKAIVGGFQGEPESIQAVQRHDGSWLMDGEMHLDAVRDILGRPQLRANHDYHTLAGFMLASFERVPTVGEQHDWEGFRFEVVDMDGSKIDKALVSRLES